MKKLIRLLLFCILFIACASFPPLIPPTLDTDPCSTATIVLIQNDNPICRAVVLGPRVAITAAHCVEGVSAIGYGTEWLPRYPTADVVVVDTDRDLAILSLSEPRQKWGHLQLNRELRVGDTVTVAGRRQAAVTDRSKWWTSIGSGTKRQLIEVDVSAPEGSSGSPLCDGSGAVVGICLGHSINGPTRGYFTSVNSVVSLLIEKS